MCLFKMSKIIRCSQLRFCFAIGLTLTIASAKAQQGESGQLRMTQQEIIDVKATGATAPGSFNVSAVQVIVIHGNPSKAGLYTILLKVAAHTKNCCASSS